jgi:hypothetical protein
MKILTENNTTYNTDYGDDDDDDDDDALFNTETTHQYMGHERKYCW